MLSDLVALCTRLVKARPLGILGCTYAPQSRDLIGLKCSDKKILEFLWVTYFVSCHFQLTFSLLIMMAFYMGILTCHNYFSLIQLLDRFKPVSIKRLFSSFVFHQSKSSLFQVLLTSFFCFLSQSLFIQAQTSGIFPFPSLFSYFYYGYNKRL